MKTLQELISLNEAKNKSLTAEDKAAIIEDFKEWSGGSTPDECMPDEISKYVEFAMDHTLDADAVENFLNDYKP